MKESRSDKRTTLKMIALVIALILIGIAIFAFVNKDEENNASTTAVDTVETTGSSDYYFRDGVLQLQDARVEITDSKVIPVGEKGNEHGDKPVIAFWYKTTNLSDKEFSASTPWIASFEAIQDNNPNTVNKLEVGMHPDDRYLDTQFENIKKGGTAEDAIAYELDDMTTPVVLKATRGMGGESLGEHTYTIKEQYGARLLQVD